MDDRELQELLRQRIHIEYMVFKDSMLQKEKEVIFRDSYKTEVFVDLYEILLEYAGSLQGGILRELLNIRSGILDLLYQQWLKREDSFYEDLRAYACSELNALPGKKFQGEKEKDDGKESDQTAESR